MPKKIAAKFVKEITVTDPDSGGDVEVELWKDPDTGGIFGVDSSFLDQVRDEVPCPFDRDAVMVLETPPPSPKAKPTEYLVPEPWKIDGQRGLTLRIDQDGEGHYSYAEVRKLPKVVEYDGRLYRQTGWNSDDGTVVYKEASPELLASQPKAVRTLDGRPWPVRANESIEDLISKIDGFHGTDLKERSKISVSDEVHAIRKWLEGQ